ncbi:MAG TPA: glycosyltransferase family 39 protein [Steroidobacteraceae bacterium]|nr:glycosyltransferase family 39 protein [Steroidobacteraceae bacterium]
MKWGAILGPGLDIAAYLIAAELGVSPGRAQLCSFGAALALGYLPSLWLRADARSHRGAAFGLHVIVVTVLAFCLRSGLLSLSMKCWGWPGSGAIVLAALATAPVIRSGYRYCASYRAWGIGSAGWRTAAIGMVVMAVAFRLVYGGQVELMPEEAYYWNYARHLDIGYLDHPPMVAWLISAGIRVFGDGEFGVRSGALCSAAIATFFVYRLTRNLFGSPSALVSIVLVQMLPFFFLAGMLMTPDAPLTAAWAASLYFLERALIENRRAAWWGVGLSLGAGLLSKYTIALVGVAGLIFAVIDPASRRWLRRPEPYAAVLLALAVFSPVIWWNAHHEWVSFLFQTSRRLADRPQFALHKLIGSAIVLLTPTGFAAAALVLRRRAPESVPPAVDEADVRRRAWSFLRVATLTPLGIFVVFSLRHEVKLDWTGAPWLATVPLLACAAVQWAGSAAGFRAMLARAWSPTLLVLLLLYGGGLYDLTWGIPGVGYGKHAELVPVGWRDLGGQVSRVADGIGQRSGKAPLVVGMDRYAIASELAFYAPDQARGVAETSSGHLFGQVGLMYERWFPPAEEKGRTLLLVAWDPADLATPDVISAVERLGPIQNGVLTRAGRIIRHYYYRVAYGYGEQPVKVSR